MNQENTKEYDVLVIGGGNAALCAAITAREQGASVLLLECAPKHSRGGNSRHTRNMRLAHETHIEPYTGAYPADVVSWLTLFFRVLQKCPTRSRRQLLQRSNHLPPQQACLLRSNP